MSNERTAVTTGPQQGMVAAHQPGQDVFKSALPEDINWKPFEAFPPSVRLAVIVGQPSEAWPYTIRVRVLLRYSCVRCLVRRTNLHE
jgi:hypothetical protein